MIGYIEGKVVSSESNRIIVLTAQGVGYEVHVPTLHVPSRPVTLFTTHVIREDSQSLYGFNSLDEKRLFELLVEVNGVGPKTAFGLVAHLGHEGVVRAIAGENAGALKEAPGIGKKGAEQIILSLKDKISKLGGGFTASPKSSTPAAGGTTSRLMGETLQACQELGYKEHQVIPVMNRLMGEREYASSEELLKGLLRELR